jgi:hypothetical protein
LDISLSLAFPPLWRWQWQRTPHGILFVIRQRYVVSTALDPAVTGYADVDRLLRTEPQVQLTPFVLNNHSNDFKSHELAFLGSHLGNVDVKVADRILAELLADGLVPFDFRQTAHAMALETAV